MYPAPQKIGPLRNRVLHSFHLAPRGSFGSRLSSFAPIRRLSSRREGERRGRDDYGGARKEIGPRLIDPKVDISAKDSSGRMGSFSV